MAWSHSRLLALERVRQRLAATAGNSAHHSHFCKLLASGCINSSRHFAKQALFTCCCCGPDEAKMYNSMLTLSFHSIMVARPTLPETCTELLAGNNTQPTPPEHDTYSAVSASFSIEDSKPTNRASAQTETHIEGHQAPACLAAAPSDPGQEPRMLEEDQKYSEPEDRTPGLSNTRKLVTKEGVQCVSGLFWWEGSQCSVSVCALLCSRSVLSDSEWYKQIQHSFVLSQWLPGSAVANQNDLAQIPE